MKSLRAGASSFATFVQVLPRLPALLAHMRPTWHFRSLRALDAAFLARERIRGLIWDVDGTLTGDGGTSLIADAEAPFRALQQGGGVRQVILSNASENRFRQLGDIFPTVYLLRAYDIGGSTAFRRRLGTVDTWTDEELERRFAAGARVIRKPSAVLIEAAVKELGCDKDEAVMVGDQYLTDVAGANLGGVRSIKLATRAGGSFRLAVRLSHGIEWLLYRLVNGRPRWDA